MHNNAGKRIKRLTREFAVVLTMLLGAFASNAVAEIFFIHNDHLGTPRAMSDRNGAVVWQAKYEPFGNATVTKTGSAAIPLAQVPDLNIRFPGQYYDAETGLHYNYYRDYDPTIGRYLQPDPIGLAGGVNPYVYALNNPLRFFDPYGLDAFVSLSRGAAGFGHVGIGVNSANTVGLRPVDASLKGRLPALTGIPGVVSADRPEDIESIIHIPLDPSDDEAVRRCIQKRRQNPEYDLDDNSCVDLVRDCLGDLGHPLSNTNFPDDLFREFERFPGASRQDFNR
jgi:RHS repeat-associated protein